MYKMRDEIPKKYRLTQEESEEIGRHLLNIEKEQEIIGTYFQTSGIPVNLKPYLYYDRVAGIDGILRINEAGLKKLSEAVNK